jgi:protein-L-isoaspartate(D-aspartate) O-methyltransferase
MNVRLQGIGMTSPRTRERMVNRMRELGICDESVLDTMLQIPRHIFVEEAFASRAYEDLAIPIGFGQTISQPYMVARMTELLLEEGFHRKVLEIGTGSGYQTAVLARLVESVFSIERIHALQERAQRCLRDLGLYNVRLRHGDGTLGWKTHAPFDAILVTAASPALPTALLEQLRMGGILVSPIGQGRKQVLHRIIRRESGYQTQSIEPALFVPLVPGTT